MVESNQRVERLREQLKAANQKILFFEAQAASLNANESPDTVLQQLKQALEQNERKGTQTVGFSASARQSNCPLCALLHRKI